MFLEAANIKSAYEYELFFLSRIQLCYVAFEADSLLAFNLSGARHDGLLCLWRELREVDVAEDLRGPHA